MLDNILRVADIFPDSFWDQKSSARRLKMKVAAVQAAPVFLQRGATTEKVLRLMREAAQHGADLCVFPETFLPGYPVWLMYLVSSLSEAQRQEAYAAYLEAAVDPNGPELQAVEDEARRSGVFTYLGFVERAPAVGPSIAASPLSILTAGC